MSCGAHVHHEQPFDGRRLRSAVAYRHRTSIGVFSTFRRLPAVVHFVLIIFVRILSVGVGHCASAMINIRIVC